MLKVISNTRKPEVTAKSWFANGTRRLYDTTTKQFLTENDPTNTALSVFTKTQTDTTPTPITTWASFLPGWPDGSFGWAKINRELADTDLGPRLFFDYIGHGRSGKPKDYPYGTIERADMVEAMWKAQGITSTFVISFDYSSIVTLELLARQQDRIEAGKPLATKIEGVLLINGGLYADGHSHPWYTTPLLKTRMGGWFTSLAQVSRPVFDNLMGSMWSREYKVTKAELDELYNAMAPDRGVYAIHKSAGFVNHHKQNPERLNLSRLYRFAHKDVAFHIVGSEQDPFEGKQAPLARQRLGAEGLDVRIIPGGHLTTSEQPERLAQIIRDVAAAPAPLISEATQ